MSFPGGLLGVGFSFRSQLHASKARSQLYGLGLSCSHSNRDVILDEARPPAAQTCVDEVVSGSQIEHGNALRVGHRSAIRVIRAGISWAGISWAGLSWVGIIR